MSDTIKVGDKVWVDFNNAGLSLTHDAIVIRRPSLAGDSWVFKALDTGFIHAISEGCTISKKIDE